MSKLQLALDSRWLLTMDDDGCKGSVRFVVECQGPILRQMLKLISMPMPLLLLLLLLVMEMMILLLLLLLL